MPVLWTITTLPSSVNGNVVAIREIQIHNTDLQFYRRLFTFFLSNCKPIFCINTQKKALSISWCNVKFYHFQSCGAAITSPFFHLSVIWRTWCFAMHAYIPNKNQRLIFTSCRVKHRTLPLLFRKYLLSLQQAFDAKHVIASTKH